VGVLPVVLMHKDGRSGFLLFRWSFFALELAFTVDESFSILSLPDSSVT
jgi:hypothetical protein